MLYQFKIQLKHIEDPKVWRQVLVPADWSFYDFHLVIQAAFGWEDYHLFMFSPKGYGSQPVISPSNPGDDPFGFNEEDLDADEILLNEVFTKKGQKFTYIYDLGDDWTHEIKLEKIIDENRLYADCLAGEGTCPPEDCGGPWGYESLKEVLCDSKNT